MDSQKIRCFLEIAKELSFTRAADRLYMSQSAVSRSIRALETEMQLELFERNSKNTVLTPAGQIMAEGLAELRDSYDQLLQKARSANEGYLSELKIGVLQEFMLDVFPYALNTFELRYPDIAVSLITEPLEILRKKLSEGKIDFLVGCREDMLLDSTKSVPIAKRRIGLAVSSRHPLAGAERELNLKDFENDLFVVLPKEAAPAYRNLIVRCSRRGFVPRIEIAPDILTIMLWVEAGRCVCILYENTAIMGNPNIRFLEMEDLPSIMAAINWTEDSLTPAKQLFIDYISGYKWSI
jgi:DNA-binding transcriptional LysR family regulator